MFAVNNQALRQRCRPSDGWSAQWPCWARRKYAIGLRRSFSVALLDLCAASPLNNKAFLIDAFSSRTEQLSLVGPKRRGSGGELHRRARKWRGGGAGRAALGTADRHSTARSARCCFSDVCCGAEAQWMFPFAVASLCLAQRRWRSRCAEQQPGVRGQAEKEARDRLPGVCYSAAQYRLTEKDVVGQWAKPPSGTKDRYGMPEASCPAALR